MHRGSSSAIVRAVVVLAALGFAGAAQSQTKAAAPSKPDPKKSKTTAALKAYDKGTRSFKSGKMDSAIKSLSSAIKTGGLSSQQMAKALYTRGLAYRKLGKPALAISDLTTSVWLKNGLSDADRAKAIVARQAAYREAGLGETAPVAAQKSTPAAPVAIKSAQAPPVAASASSASSTPAATPAPVAAPPANTIPAPGAAPKVATAPTQSWESSTSAVSTPAPVTVENKNAVEQASSTVAGFFSNLFSPSTPQQSGSAATATPSSSITTSVAPQKAATPAPAPSVSSSPPGGPVNSLQAAVAPTARPSAAAPAAPAPQTTSTGFTTTTAPAPQPVPSATPVTSTTVAKTAVATPQATGTGFVTTTSAQPAQPPAYTAPQNTPALAASKSPNALEQAGAAVTGFFGNLFSGGGSTGTAATQSPSSNVATSSTGASGGPTSAVSSWSQGTEVAAKTPAKGPQPTRVAAVSSPTAAPAASAAAPSPQVAALPPQASPSGDFRLQVAAVRSRDDAARVAAQIKKDHAFRLGARQTEIDKAVIGNMGTFYRVRIGPYANATEPRKLCTVLRPHGYDCLVVTQ